MSVVELMQGESIQVLFRFASNPRELPSLYSLFIERWNSLFYSFTIYFFHYLLLSPFILSPSSSAPYIPLSILGEYWRSYWSEYSSKILDYAGVSK